MMTNEMFPSEQLHLTEPEDSVLGSKALGNFQEEKLNEQPETHHSSVGEDDGGAEEGMPSSDSYHHEQQQQHQPFNADFEGLHNLFLDVVSPSFLSWSDEIKKLFNVSTANDEPQKERPYAASLEILTNYESRLRRLNGEKIKIPQFEVKSGLKVVGKPSTNETLKLAAEKFIQSSIPNVSSLLGLGPSEEYTSDVELVLHLLYAADKVADKDYHKAKKLLKKCSKHGFDRGNPVQRLVHYFSASLGERVDRASGGCDSIGSGRAVSDFIGETLSTISSTALAFRKAVPFCCVSQFAGMQVIIEQVEGARKVHIIDLHIWMGMQYTVLIQALAARSECPVELLKITAVATKCKEAVDATGGRLASFAASFNLPFAFHVVLVEDVLDLHEGLFEIDDEEAVAVYSAYFLMLVIEKPDRLQSLMDIIRNINPSVMVVTEVEANLNSPVFVDRFTEALFYYGAFFDAFEDCLKDDDPNRLAMESIYFSPGIKNVVAAEEEERTIRMVKINVWRKFFARFGMIELELSTSSICQANLLLKKFSCGDSCTLEMDGKSLLVGWKGTPVYSLSAWIFN